MVLRLKPGYKQPLYRDDVGRLIVTISQNSVGNAITELLGIVVKRGVQCLWGLQWWWNLMVCTLLLLSGGVKGFLATT